jgi:Ca2+-binding RTX toxin-like protein
MAINKSIRRRDRLSLQSLADRIVPAITFTDVAGHLTIIGDDNNNSFEVAVSGDKKFILRFAPNSPALNTNVPVKGTTEITIQGNGGNDNIRIAPLGSLSIANAITVQGGAGNDTLFGSSKADNLDGGANNDSLFGGAGNDTVFGNTGNDTLTGSLGNDFVSGGDDIDTILENGNVNFFLSNAFGGPSLTAGVLGTDPIASIEIGRLIGGAGNNLINASSFIGSVFLDGGGGNDTLIGALGSDTMVGGTGNDSLDGSLGDDSLTGATGNDTLRGDAGDDLLVGGFGVDVIDGGDDDDRLSEAFGSTALKTLTLTNTTFRHKEGTLDVTDSLISM